MVNFEKKNRGLFLKKAFHKVKETMYLKIILLTEI